MTRYTPLSRRTVLQSLPGIALAGVAGCLAGDDAASTPNDSNADGQGVLDRVAVQGMSLVVGFDSAAGIDRINLIQPTGESYGQRDVTTGAQQVSFDLGTSYVPGEYTVVALREGETLVETSVAVEPEIVVTDMGIGQNQPEKMWAGDDSEIRENAFVTVENVGSGPSAITKLLFIGDVPYPSDGNGTDYVDAEEVSGIFDSESRSEVTNTVVNSSEKKTIYSSRSPFAFVPGAGTSCTTKALSSEFDLILETSVRSDRITKTYNIRYSGAEKPGGCNVSITEG